MSWDFFLAHAGSDVTPAEQIYDLLSVDHRVFLDKRTLLPGDDWDLAISKALHETCIIVVLVSGRYESAYYLREEIAVAIALARKEPGAHRVVPIFLDGWPSDTSGVPYGLRLKQGLDGKKLGIEGVAIELRRLVAQLARSPLPAPPSSPLARNDRTELFDALCKLLPAQFESVLFLSRIPHAQMSPNTVPQTIRAIELVQHTESEGSLDALAELIKKVAPGLRL